jgi:aryl-alcohol dehydrogenase-like predicted oxidoreductase
VPVNPEEDDMRTVKLGATRLEVTPIAYGTWQFGGDWGPVDEWAAVSAIEHARSLGINFSDTAQIDEFAAVLPVETVQPPHHLFRRDIETSLLPYAGVHDIGVLVAWVLANPAVQVAIAGARAPPTSTRAPAPSTCGWARTTEGRSTRSWRPRCRSGVRPPKA